MCQIAGSNNADKTIFGLPFLLISHSLVLLLLCSLLRCRIFSVTVAVFVWGIVWLVFFLLLLLLVLLLLLLGSFFRGVDPVTTNLMSV